MKQSTVSILRQIGAVLVSVYGVLTSTVTPLHLPVAVSAVLTSFGPAIIILEHFLSDPRPAHPAACVSAVSWAAVLGSVASVITAVAVLLAVLGVRVRVNKVQEAVQTANGDTIGERIDRIGDLTEAIEAVRIDKLPRDGVERRKTPGT